MFWKAKSEDKLWREVNSRLDKKAWVLYIIIMLFAIVYIGMDWKFNPELFKGFGLGLVFLVSIITVQLYTVVVSLCRIIQKQQEQLDKLLEKTGLIKPKSEISIEIKDILM
ncbi:MAG: hypothetical protein ACE14V_02260, partial [bacterium]